MQPWVIITIVVAVAAEILIILKKKIAPKKEPSAAKKRKWRAEFQPFAKLGKKLVETKSRTVTKIGGMPTVPYNFVWPENDGKCLPFLLQADFSEINPDGELADFPKSGVMYLFADGEAINDGDYSIDGYPEGKTFKTLYFDTARELAAATKPDNLSAVYEEINLAAKSVDCYPSPDDCEEVRDICGGKNADQKDDYYFDLASDNINFTLVGGYPVYIQDSILQDLPQDDFVLLMQIKSYESDELMWGDNGCLYLFIRKADLRARNFNGVTLQMQCY